LSDELYDQPVAPERSLKHPVSAAIITKSERMLVGCFQVILFFV
jgi:hypothetical protein